MSFEVQTQLSGEYKRPLVRAVACEIPKIQSIAEDCISRCVQSPTLKQAILLAWQILIASSTLVPALNKVTFAVSDFTRSRKRKGNEKTSIVKTGPVQRSNRLSVMAARFNLANHTCIGRGE